MKKLSGIVCMLCLFQVCVMAQSRIPGNIEFTTQQQIDNFPIDSHGCIDIEGDVVISGPFINNLIGLQGITHIGGDLRIGSSRSFISFYSDLMGLNSLTSVGGNLEIRGNGTLESLLGLERLTSVGGSLIIDQNLALKDISALRSLHNIQGNVTISRNESLVDLSGLNSLGVIHGSLTIRGNTSLISFRGMENLSHILGFLEISGNPNLASLEGLNHLKKLEGKLSVENNDALLALAGLDNIDPYSVTELSIVNNASLGSCEVSSISGYLSQPAGKVDIYNNADGCNTPAQVAAEGNMTLDCLPFGSYNFHCQEDIDLFSENYGDCAILSGDVVITGSEITSLDGLHAVTTINGSLVIFDCDRLESLAGLENLIFIEKGAFIGDNARLASLEGLDNLSHIGEFLQIDFNESLANLEGLENLVSAGTALRIEGNRSMTSLAGLERLQGDKLENIIIINNFNLDICHTENFCALLEEKSCQLSIFNNKEGCQTLHELEMACRGDAEAPVTLNEICQYRLDPVTGKVTFIFEVNEPMEVQMVIYDLSGLFTETLVDQVLPRGGHEVSWSPSGSSTGIYFYNLTAGNLFTAGEFLVSR